MRNPTAHSPGARRRDAFEALFAAGRGAFGAATRELKRALARGDSARERLTALGHGFAALVASPEGRTLAMTDFAAVDSAASNRVRRYRRLLRDALVNVLDDGRDYGELLVRDSQAEADEWLRLADSLPRQLCTLPEPRLREVAVLVFAARADACLPPPRRRRR